MQPSPLTNILRSKDLGPITKILSRLENSDLRNLSQVLSSNLNEMRNNQVILTQLAQTGREIEKEEIPLESLSFRSKIPSIHEWIAKQKQPYHYLNLSWNERGQSEESDLHNIQFAIQKGEKITQPILESFILLYPNSWIDMMTTYSKNYSTLYFQKIIPFDAIALSLVTFPSLNSLVKVYELLGKENMNQIFQKIDMVAYVSSIVPDIQNLNLELDEIREADQMGSFGVEDFAYLSDFKRSLERTFQVLKKIGDQYRILKNRYAIDSLNHKTQNYLVSGMSSLQTAIEFMNYLRAIGYVI